jgi:hypothetical protein
VVGQQGCHLRKAASFSLGQNRQTHPVGFAPGRLAVLGQQDCHLRKAAILDFEITPLEVGLNVGITPPEGLA